MIARIVILLLAVVIAPELYFQLRRLYRGRTPWWKNVLIWVPCLLMTAYTVYLALDKDFYPLNAWLMYVYLLLLGLYFIPRAIVAICMAVGQGAKPRRRRGRSWSKILGIVLSLLVIYVLIYGVTIGPRKLEVKRVDITLSKLPAAFDGYRIVLLADIHAGAIDEQLLTSAVDSVNMFKADAIAFAGDIQNMTSAELKPFAAVLTSLKARDGVFSVLGNHDYCSFYRKSEPPAVLQADEQKTIALQRSFGWQMLCNEHKAVTRGSDTIYFVGTENDGHSKKQQKGDFRKAVAGVPDGAFMIMLQHDPSSWQRNVLPKTTAQLTLSGHTHGGQLALFGLRATQVLGLKDYGLYEDSGRYLYVTSGLGSLFPFRFGVPPEIVVITLRSATIRK